jgi:hypothetical protein
MRAQYAMEYTIVLGILFALIVGGIFVYYGQARSLSEHAQSSQVDSIGKTIIAKAEEIYYSPGFARRTVDVETPEIIDTIYIENFTTLVINVSTSAGESAYAYFGKVPMRSLLTESDISTGRIILEKSAGNFVILCGEQQCTCVGSELFPDACNNGIDDDCDGKTDSCDTECGTDPDLDNYTWNCTIHPDCAANDATIYPGAPEYCNDKDDDCDGLVDDGYDADVCQVLCEKDPLQDWDVARLGQHRCCGDDPAEGRLFEDPELNINDNMDNDCDGSIDELGCRFTSTGCVGGEICLMRLQNSSGGDYNAHVQDCSIGTYGNTICCEYPGETLSMSTALPCEQVIISMSNDSIGGGWDNAHVAEYVAGSPFYDNHVCLEALGPSVVACQTKPACDTPNNEFCVLKYENETFPGGTTNAHVAPCDSNYANNICCKIT